MASRSVIPDNSAIRTHSQFNGLDNVLGVVYEAAFKYLSERRVRGPNDLVTFIPFDDSQYTTFAGEGVGDVQALLHQMMQVKPGGGTQFAPALSHAHQSIQQVRCYIYCHS